MTGPQEMVSAYHRGKRDGKAKAQQLSAREVVSLIEGVIREIRARGVADSQGVYLTGYRDGLREGVRA